MGLLRSSFFPLLLAGYVEMKIRSMKFDLTGIASLTIVHTPIMNLKKK